MRQSDFVTRVFIQHKADVILKNGPLEQLAVDGSACFRRLMDIFCQEGPKDKRDTNWWCILDSLLRRNPGKASFRQEGAGYTIIMENTEWTPGIQGRGGPVGLSLTVPSRGWTYEIPPTSLGTNVGTILAMDRFMPEIIHQSETMSMLARIKLAERDALQELGAETV